MRKHMIIAFAVLLALGMMLCSCGTGDFAVSGTEEGTVEITADNAAADAYALAGSVIVDENGMVTIDYDFAEGGELQVQLIRQSDEQSADMSEEEIQALADGDKADHTELISGTGEMSFVVEPGEYNVLATVIEKLTGTATISGQSTQIPNPWQEADSAEEAAKGAGMDTFTIPEGAEISLGTIEAERFTYMDGAVDAAIPIGAVEMTIRKIEFEGEPKEQGDISGDYNEYQYEWTQDVDGVTVTCHGNREGEATETIWTSDGYGYAILAYGAGGDDDYGLPAEDVAVIVRGVK